MPDAYKKKKKTGCINNRVRYMQGIEGENKMDYLIPEQDTGFVKSLPVFVTAVVGESFTKKKKC